MIALYFNILRPESVLNPRCRNVRALRTFISNIYTISSSAARRKTEKRGGNLRGSAFNLKKWFYSRGNRKSVLRMQEERCKKTHRDGENAPRFHMPPTSPFISSCLCERADWVFNKIHQKRVVRSAAHVNDVSSINKKAHFSRTIVCRSTQTEQRDGTHGCV